MEEGTPSAGGAGTVGIGRSRRKVVLAGLGVLVYLSATPADGPRDTFDDEFLSLGRYRSVVIWCRRFTYAFGAAELAPAR
jgi:Electron transfer DM13